MSNPHPRFWMVFCPTNSLHPPKVMHPSKEKATEEAARLARLNIGQEFYVLQVISVSCVEQQPVIVRNYEV